MEISLFSLQSLIFILLFIQASHRTVNAQTTNSNVTDFSCSSNSVTCDTYVIYRTQSPEFLDTGNVSDLFDVSRRSIMTANNLPSEDVTFLPNQLLLVPISCGCSGNQSFANITYRIKAGDSFYLVSIHAFEYLTNYVVVQSLNPTLEPTKLKPGDDVIFPLFCKCPSKTQFDQGLDFLISYVWQAGDHIFELSRRMNSSAEAIAAANNYRNFSDAERHPILIPVSKPPIIPLVFYNATLFVEQKPKSYRTTIIVLFTAIAVLALVLGIVLLFCYCKCFQKKVFARTMLNLETVNPLRFKKPSNVETLSPRTMVDKILPEVSQCLDNMVVFDTTTIMESTANLDEKYRISGSVYRATINGQVLAVKKAKGDVSEELKILHKVNHANLVKLAGVSTDSDGDFFLLYEYAENGSLDKWFHPKKPSSVHSVSVLSWRRRLSIALDVANGLQYLHEHTRPSIVHRDVGAHNILLDAHFKAKISNFSMAKPSTVTVTPATDVLAFGVVLLELLSGKRSMEIREGDDMGLLWKEIMIILELEEKKEERLRKWMDRNLESVYPIDGALNLAALAKACTSPTASERPRMAEIVFSLSILAQSSSDAFKMSETSNCEENIPIMNPLFAR